MKSNVSKFVQIFQVRRITVKIIHKLVLIQITFVDLVSSITVSTVDLTQVEIRFVTSVTKKIPLMNQIGLII